MGAEGEVLCGSELECGISFRGLPEGTKVKIGSAEGVMRSISVSVHPNLGDKIGALAPITALAHEASFDPGETLQITFPDGAKIDSPLPKVTVKFGLELTLDDALKAGKPLLFGSEKPDDPAPKQHTVWSRSWVRESEVLGPAKQMRDIDRVAVAEAQPKRLANKKCGGYVAKDGDKERTLELYLIDSKVKLVDRRTGKLVEEKTFAARATCPRFAHGDEATTTVDSDVIHAWLKARP